MKKSAQRKRKHCALAVVRRSQRNFAPPQTPSRGRGTAEIYSAGDDHYLYLKTQFGEDRCTQFRVIVVTDSQTNTSTNTHKHTNTTDYNTLRRSFASAQCKHTVNAKELGTHAPNHGDSEYASYVGETVKVLSLSVIRNALTNSLTRQCC